MVLTLAFAEFSASANALNGKINLFVDKAAQLPAQDRINLITIVYPLVIIDGGVDTLINMIEEHSPQSESMIDGYITKLLEYVTKEDIIFALRALKIIPENVRREYFRGFVDRKEFELSEKSRAYVDEFLELVYKKIPNLKKIFIEDGITGGVAAEAMRIIPAANDNMPLFSVDENYIFKPYYLSADIADKWASLASERKLEPDLKKSADILADRFNNSYSVELRQRLAYLFTELGLCRIAYTTAADYKNVASLGGGEIMYPIVYAYFDNGKMLYKTENAKKSDEQINLSDIEGWYKNCITELAYMGIVSGRGDGKFYPNDNVTREEFVKMICSAVNLPNIDTPTPFEDVDNDAWYGRYVRTAYYYKIINGQSADKFGTGKNISRQDAAVICNNIIRSIEAEKTADITFADGADIAEYAKDSVYNLAQLGVINGDNLGNFNPTAGITRAESAKIINELIHLIVNH